MKKAILTGISLVVLLTACSSGDDSKKNRENFHPNSKVQLIPASQMETVQQEQDFPESKSTLANQQYADATATTAMKPVVISDVSDEGDSGTSLPAITQPNAPIQPISIPSAPAPTAVPTPAPSAAQNLDSSLAQLPSVSGNDFPPPVTAASGSSDQTARTEGAGNLLNNQSNNMPNTASAPQSASLSASAPQQPALMTNSTLSAQNRAIVQNSSPSSATIANPPVTESYESLDSQAAAPSTSSTPYSSFDNVATPVTFTNSPYNSQLNSYGGSSPAAAEPAGVTKSAPASAP